MLKFLKENESIKLPDQNSIPTEKSKTTINVFPNPVSASGALHLSLNNNLSNSLNIRLITSDGRSVLNKIIPSGVQNFSINVGGYKLNQGYYILKVTSENFNYSHGIVIQ